MKKRNLFLLLSILFTSVAITPIDATFYIVKNGSLVNSDEAAIFSVEEHYTLGAEAFELCDWDEAAKQFRIVSYNFPSTVLGQDANFFLGVACYHLKEFDFSNEAFSAYLRCHTNPQYFEEAISFKFNVANQFKQGARRRFFGTKHLPKWASGRSHAYEIYDEVIAAVPCHDLAAWSLFSKAQMLKEDGRYAESIDVYQLLIRRFPKHELAPESYLAISKIFIDQSLCEMQNPDLLAFAQINLRRFSQDFPREERISIIEQDVMRLKEIYATALFETGQFYERIHKPFASVIYYQNAVDQFPETCTAQQCQQRLKALRGFIPALPECDNTSLSSLPNMQNDSSS